MKCPNCGCEFIPPPITITIPDLATQADLGRLVAEGILKKMREERDNDAD